MSLTKSEYAVKREILVKFSKNVDFQCLVVLAHGQRGKAPAGLCPICFPGAFAVDLLDAPRAVVCARHYWHPVARLFRVASSLFLPSSGRCLTQNPGGRDPRVMTNVEGRMTNLRKGAKG